MTEAKPAPSFFERLHWLGSEILLGTLVAILAVGTAGASYLSSMSDSDQTKYNVLGMQKLTNANADYLTANQQIIQDYNYYDSFYLNRDKPDLSEYYKFNFSPELTAGMARSEEEPFDEAYYTAMYAGPEQTFDEADKLFKAAEDFNTRGDQFQLVVLIGALGLTFAAWGSLLPEGQKIRLLFSVLSIIILVYGIITFLQIPAPPVIPTIS